MDIEIYDQAHSILSQRRAKAIAENDRRIREINEKIPEIREINDALFNTGKELISIISSAKGSDVSQKIEQVKKRNLEAQKLEQQILASHGYPDDYLRTKFYCEECSDTGYCNGKICVCLNKIFSQLATQKLNEKTKLSLSSFDTFSLSYYDGTDLENMTKILNFTKKYAEEFTSDSDSILMFGNTGLGKTHLSLSIANEAIKKGYSVIYDSASNILRDIEKEYFGYEKSTEIYDIVTSCDLLILDDLGTEIETKSNKSYIYNIINSRLSKSRPTIISTNMNFEEISERYTGKVASRITAAYKCINFKGMDVRLQKKKDELEKTRKKET